MTSAPLRVRRRVVVRGVVQGVGFRPHAYALARSLDLTGAVWNTDEGVVVEVEGAAEDVESFTKRIGGDAPPLAVVSDVALEDLAPLGGTGFSIRDSADGSARAAARTFVSPDVTICDDCLADLRDPSDRRYRHPFVTCTNCGPRYTITTGLPYDRPATTMAGFAMCSACAAEYADPADRRFHAQTVCCPSCGPTLSFVAAGLVTTYAERALAAARSMLRDGGVVAVKGIGGYHLACDATDQAAVATLRERKRRGDKPFAVMVSSLDDARGLVDLTPAEATLIASRGRPIDGGGKCFVVGIGANGSNDGRKQGSATKELGPAPRGVLGGFRQRPSVVRPAASRSSWSWEDAGGDSPPADEFKLVIRVEGKVAETFDHVTTKAAESNVATIVNRHSKVINLEETTSGSALTKPANGVGELVAPEAEPVKPTPDKLRADDYVGDVADRTGLSGLEAVDEVTMVAVPDLAAALEQEAIDLETFKAVLLGMIAHCELMGDRVAILDTPPALNPHQVHQWRVKEAGYDSQFATMYWPWLKVFDPATATNKFVPPAGHMAGVWARSADSRGVHKAPANEVVRGAIELQTQITKDELDLLNPVGINCVRSFRGRGLRVWGARTLSSDAEWRYLNLRRLFNYLKESILLGTQWVVFESNDHALWARIRRTISAFLINEWRKGALFGTTPDEAFFVKCDEETNPAEGIGAGQVVSQIGVAPVKPAEFVIFQLSQFSGGTSLVSE